MNLFDFVGKKVKATLRSGEVVFGTIEETSPGNKALPYPCILKQDGEPSFDMLYTHAGQYLRGSNTPKDIIRLELHEIDLEQFVGAGVVSVELFSGAKFEARVLKPFPNEPVYTYLLSAPDSDSRPHRSLYVPTFTRSGAYNLLRDNRKLNIKSITKLYSMVKSQSFPNIDLDKFVGRKVLLIFNTYFNGVSFVEAFIHSPVSVRGGSEKVYKVLNTAFERDGRRSSSFFVDFRDIHILEVRVQGDYNLNLVLPILPNQKVEEASATLAALSAAELQEVLSRYNSPANDDLNF